MTRIHRSRRQRQRFHVSSPFRFMALIVIAALALGAVLRLLGPPRTSEEESKTKQQERLQTNRQSLAGTKTQASSFSYNTSSWPFLNNNDPSARAAFLQDKKLRRGRIHNAEFLFQLPSSSSSTATATTAPAKGLLFLAHGCHHAMTDWWLPTPTADDTTCPDCLGLPEERAIVELALKQHHFAVVAMSSFGKCWSSREGPVVANVLAQVSRFLFSSSTTTTPTPPIILAFGASSGGHFVSTVLPRAMQELNCPLQGVISQISASKTAPSHSIPTVWITMNRDRATDARAVKAVAHLQEQGIASRHVRLAPQAVTTEFLMQRIGYNNRTLASSIVQALQKAKLLDKKYMLVDDPRQSDWRSIVRPLLALQSSASSEENDSLVPDKSPLSEVLNVAWGMHEMSRDGVDEALAFLFEAAASS